MSIGNETDHAVPAWVNFVDRTSVELQCHWGRLSLVGNLQHRAREPVRRARADAISAVVRPLELRGEAAARKLLEYEAAVERQMAELLSRRSWYYWLHLARRIAPGPPPGEDFDPWTESLELSIFHLAYLKYGGRDVAEFEYVDSEMDEIVTRTAIPREITEEDALAIMQVRELAKELNRVQARLRCVWKGAPLRFGEDGEPQPWPWQSLADLIALNDRRRAEYEASLAGCGLQMEGLVWVPPDEGVFDLSPWTVVIPFPNMYSVPWDLRLYEDDPLVPKGKANLFQSNYVPLLANLEPVLETAELFAEEVSSTTGVTPLELLGTIRAMLFRNWLSMKGRWPVRFAFFQRGWSMLLDAPSLRDDIAPFYRDFERGQGRQCTASEARVAVRSALDAMMSGLVQFDEIDLGLRGPPQMILPTPGSLTVDWCHLTQYLAWVLRSAVGHGGRAGSRRGKLFEQQVDRTLRTELPGYSPWGSRRVLEFPDGKRAEVDVAFKQGSALLVVECRSAIAPPALDRGEPDKIANRKKDVVEPKLRQADAVSAKIARYPRGRNYEVPSGCDYVVSLACGPSVEYFDTRSDYYFLTHEIPRMCTPAELVEFARGLRPEAHRRKPYCYRVRWGKTPDLAR